MKKIYQKIISVMVTALMVFSITISASAFCYTGGTSCAGASNSQSAGCENSNTCTSGYDAESNSSCWNVYGSSAYCGSFDCSNAAGTSADWMNLVTQYIGNCTKNSAGNNNESAAEDETAAPADSSATVAATEAASCNNSAAAADGADICAAAKNTTVCSSNTTAAENADDCAATNNTTACNSDTAAAEDAYSCAAVNSCGESTEVNSADGTAASEPENSNIEQSAVAAADDTGSCAKSSPIGNFIEFWSNANSNVTQYLSCPYEVCRLSLKHFGICLPDCSVTTEDTTQPSDTTTDETTNGENDGTDAAPAESDNAATQTPEQNTTDTTTDNQNIDNLSFEEQVAALVNEQRAENGLAPLTLSEELSNVARIKSQDMHDQNYFSHTSPTYGSPFDMLQYFGISYRAAGENIAMGYSTPEAVMEAWMNSSGHRANILNASYTQIGVGYVADGNYWTQEFIG